MTTRPKDPKGAQNCRELTEAEADSVQGGIGKREAAVALGGQSVGRITLDESQGPLPNPGKPDPLTKARHDPLLATITNLY